MNNLLQAVKVQTTIFTVINYILQNYKQNYKLNKM